MLATLTVDVVVDRFPGWAYPVLILVAFAAAVFLSGVGLRILGRAVQRVRRLTPTSQAIPEQPESALVPPTP